MLSKFANRVIGHISWRWKMKQVEDLIESGLPVEMRPALEYLATRKADAVAQIAIEEAETRRAAIANQGNQKVPIWYSPKPGSSGDDTSSDARPQPGEELEFSMEKVAATGKGEKWGTVLHLIARGFCSTTAVELGSCAGISAMYLSSAPSIETLITVEGSPALAGIAKESLESRPNVTVVNSRFDDAIDVELPLLDRKINLAFIDGHHEKTATIHYFNRLLQFLDAGAVVIFDDISWSHDMREAWEALCRRCEFAHSLDLGYIGICTLRNAGDKATLPVNWDLRAIFFPRSPSIGNPKGWKE